MATYFMGAKKVVSKKTGEVYFFISLLRKNRYNDWEVFTTTADTEETYIHITDDCSVGDPVKVLYGDNNKIAVLEVREDVLPLELDS